MKPASRPKILAMFSVVLLMGSVASAGNLGRFILKQNGSEGLTQEVQAQGGSVHKKMAHLDALVVHLPLKALVRLQRKNPDLEIYEDSHVQLEKSAELHPDAKGGNKPGGNQPAPPQVTPWGFDRIGASNVHGITRGAGAKVCVVDTGVDQSHEDLAGNLIGGRNFVVQKGRVNKNHWNDDNGHGTHVAGTIAALDNHLGSVGVAPEASIFAVKVLDSRGGGFLSDVTDGIYECMHQGADIINMSLGASSDPNLDSPFKQAVDAAAGAGIFVVVAAGNEGASIDARIPAGYSSVIAVAASASNDSIPGWSNFGLRAQDFTAPGVGVFSTWMNGSYNTISGTSMAAPHVSGVIALSISNALVQVFSWDLGYTQSSQGDGLINLQ